MIFPGGCGDVAEGMVSLGLWNESDKAIDIDFGVSVNDGSGKQVVYDPTTSPINFAPLDVSRGLNDFAMRSTLMSALIDGALVIEVRMKLSVPGKSFPPPFIPKNPVAKMIQGVFLDKKYSDIVFEVEGGKGKDSAMTVAKTAPVAFPAHRLIVENCSSIFADLCESHVDWTTTIQITGVSPDVFRILLFHIYGGKVLVDDMKYHAKEIINVADRFGVTSLKLDADAFFVEDTAFTIENVMELLLYSDSKNCAIERGGNRLHFGE